MKQGDDAVDGGLAFEANSNTTAPQVGQFLYFYLLTTTASTFPSITCTLYHLPPKGYIDLTGTFLPVHVSFPLQSPCKCLLTTDYFTFITGTQTLGYQPQDQLCIRVVNTLQYHLKPKKPLVKVCNKKSHETANCACVHV